MIDFGFLMQERRRKPPTRPYVRATFMNFSEHPMQNNKRLLLAETLPAFATELQQLLIDKGEHELTAQLPDLVILDHCRCGDNFCATFYTQPKPHGGYGSNHRNVALAPEEGMLILDIVGDKIACVEVLYRDEVREKLIAALP